MEYCRELEKLPIGILICAKDENLTILNANSSAHEVLGYTPNELEREYDNKLCSIIVDDIKDLFNDITDTPDEIFDYDVRVKNRNGSERWIHNIVRYDSQNATFYIVISDITDKVMSSQLYLTLEEKLETEKAINICLESLHDNKNEQESMTKLLEVLINFYAANTTFILNSTTEDNVIKNYELIQDNYGVVSETNHHITSDFYKVFFEQHKDCSEVTISTLQDNFDNNKTIYDLYRQYNIQKILLAPIKNQQKELMAFIGIINPEKSTNVISLIKMVSKFIADYIDKKKLFSKMQELSYSDSLTGLKNRHSYILKLEEIKKQHPAQLGVSYIDLNGLKIANDTQGHEFGDKLITTLSTMLKKYYGAEVYRVGGDEFIALCENINREDFEHKNQQLKFDMKEDSVMDASIGFFWSDTNMDVLSQLEMAENLMYIEKQHYYEVNEITRRGKK